MTSIWLFWELAIWSVILIAAHIASAYLTNWYEKNWFWEPKEAPDPEERIAAIRFRIEREQSGHERSLKGVIAFFAAGMSLIFAAGIVLAHTADTLAGQTGLGSSFIGATLVAASTSLPELSVTITAVRLNNFDTAVSNIFGSNSGIIVALFLADFFYREGAILQAADTSVHINVAVGIMVTTIYLLGLLLRRNRTFFGAGYDSVFVAIFYVATVFILYQLR